MKKLALLVSLGMFGNLVATTAAGVISYDQANGRFVMRTYRAGGEMLEPDILV